MKRLAHIFVFWIIIIIIIQYIPEILSTAGNSMKKGIDSVVRTTENEISNKIDNAVEGINSGIQNIFRENTTAAPDERVTEVTVRPDFEAQAQFNPISRISEIQELLNALGYNAGKVDGIWGSMTKLAMNNFQTAHNIPITDEINYETYQALLTASGQSDATTVDKCPIHGYTLAFGDECCGCIGEHIFGDDPSLCLSCKMEFEICDHSTGYSEHPHTHAFCTKCGTEFDDLFREDGRELSYCSKCFPQDTLDNDHLSRMAELSMLAYSTRKVFDDPKIQNLIVNPTGTAGIYTLYGEVPYLENGTRWVNALRITQESGYADSLIDVSNTADGKLVMTIAFEGSKEIWNDWIVTDFRTEMTPEGVHKGFATRAKDYIYGIFNGEYYIEATINGISSRYRLSDILGHIQSNKDAHLRITGHSLGGALAQTLAYYLVKGELFCIPSDRIEVYTFASPVPFSYEAVEATKFRNMNIYNFINVQDFVPNFGVTACDGIAARLAELAGYQISAVLHDDDADGGFTRAGTNLGTNIYVNPKDEHLGFTEHFMEEVYLGLIDDYINGNIYSYVFDTDVFFSEYYDLKTHQAKTEFLEVADTIIKALKVTSLGSKVVTKLFQ